MGNASTKNVAKLECGNAMQSRSAGMGFSARVMKFWPRVRPGAERAKRVERKAARVAKISLRVQKIPIPARLDCVALPHFLHD